MGKYLVSFDLDSTSSKYTQDYLSIEETLKKFGFCFKALNNVYLVATDKSCVDIRSAILDCSSTVNSILIVQLNGVYASYNYSNINEKIEQLMNK